MSSLWTPYGEVAPEPEPPAGGAPDRPEGGTPPPPGPEGPGREPTEEELAEMQAQLLSTPVADLVANNAVQLYELSVLHLTYARAALEAVKAGDPAAGEGRGSAAHAHHSAEASLAIDSFGAILDAAGDRLGPAGEQLREILTQLRLAYVQTAS